MKKRQKHIQELTINRGFHIAILCVTLFLLFGAFLLRNNVSRISEIGYLGLLLVNFIFSATVLFPLPTVASVFIAGALWNPILVGISSGLGASLGELSGYLLGYSGRGLANHRFSKNKKFFTVEQWFRTSGFVTILLFALIPNPIFDFVGLLAGTFQYPVWKYMIATFIGRSVRNFLIALAGAHALPL